MTTRTTEDIHAYNHSDEGKAARARYKAKTKRLYVDINTETDPDIIAIIDALKAEGKSLPAAIKAGLRLYDAARKM